MATNHDGTSRGEQTPATGTHQSNNMEIMSDTSSLRTAADPLRRRSSRNVFLDTDTDTPPIFTSTSRLVYYLSSSRSDVTPYRTAIGDIPNGSASVDNNPCTSGIAVQATTSPQNASLSYRGTSVDQQPSSSNKRSNSDRPQVPFKLQKLHTATADQPKKIFARLSDVTSFPREPIGSDIESMEHSVTPSTTLSSCVDMVMNGVMPEPMEADEAEDEEEEENDDYSMATNRQAAR